MLRIGIIGSDNSHSIAFSQLANLEEGFRGYRVEGVRVTHIYGTDASRTEEVAERGRIPNIVADKEEMLGAVDGVICVWRSGDKHWPDTAPFLKAGLPAFVDKPLACSIDDAERLIDAAQAAGVGFTSFSTLRFAVPTRAFVEDLRRDGGPLLAGSCSGPAQLDSEHCGIFFYGIHTVELMNAVWGYGCRRVTTAVQGPRAVAACEFGSGALVTLNFLSGVKSPFHVTVFGEDAWRSHTVDNATAYAEGMRVFVETMKTGEWPFTSDQLLEPVRILSAIDRSFQEGRPVEVV